MADPGIRRNELAGAWRKLLMGVVEQLRLATEGAEAKSSASPREVELAEIRTISEVLQNLAPVIGAATGESPQVTENPARAYGGSTGGPRELCMHAAAGKESAGAACMPYAPSPPEDGDRTDELVRAANWIREQLPQLDTPAMELVQILQHQARERGPAELRAFVEDGITRAKGHGNNPCGYFLTIIDGRRKRGKA